MKKTLTIMTAVALFAPLAIAGPVSAKTTTARTTQAASQRHVYTIRSSSFYKTAKTYHTNNAKPVVYKATIGVDRPTIALTAKGKLKARTTYKVTKQVNVKINSKKSQKYSYVNGQGWVIASQLTAGKAKAASGVKAQSFKYNVVSTTTFKKSQTFHTKDASPLVYKATIAADRPAMTLTVKGKLKSATTYKVTKQVKLRNAAKKTSTFSYVKGNGWVLKSALTSGQFKNAD